MAITTAGFDGTVNEAQWARLMQYGPEGGYRHVVGTGFIASAGGGTRQTVVSSGAAVVSGVLVESDASVTLTHAANTGTSTRTDYVVLRVDWAANTVTLAIVQGASSVAPALTQTAGVLWEMPLARVAVRGGVTTILAADVTVARPLLRRLRVFRGSAIAGVVRGPNSPPVTVSSGAVPDPGWPYVLSVTAALRFESTASGVAAVTALVGSTTLGVDHSPRLSLAGLAPTHLAATSDTLTGAVTAVLQISPSSMDAGSQLTLVGSAAMNHFTVHQIPA